MSQYLFETEVNDLMQLIIHSLYSHKEIFLRELISNASDALDKLKYLTLTQEAFKTLEFVPEIHVSFTQGEKPSLSISDNGIGMNQEDLIAHLGTIAKSGTKSFLKSLTGDAKKDNQLIGQFGVGFYSAFMVANEIEVLSRKAGEEQAYLWKSDGKGSYTIEKSNRTNQGTTVTLFLNEEGKEYSERWQIENILKKYSNHIAFPIFLHYDSIKYDKEGKEESREKKVEQVNNTIAIWKQAKSQITQESYREFYENTWHDSQEPLLISHTQAEGNLEYTSLFFVPAQAPFDLYHADYKPGVKLYVKRVFISDSDKELLPSYLRFVKGIIDSEDLPLNVSREILQQNRILSTIRSASVKKILGELENLSKTNPEKFASFTQQFNKVLKEGLYSDYSNKERLMDLVRFKTTHTAEGYTSLEEYISRMPSEQNEILYLSGNREEILRHNPLVESFVREGKEVLLLCDEIDEFIAPMLGPYKEKNFKSIAHIELENSEFKSELDERQKEDLVEKIKKVLGTQIKDVRISQRLGEEVASCLVVDSKDPSYQMQAIMRSMGQKVETVAPILEVNPKHILTKKLMESTQESQITDISLILLAQAQIAEGAPVKEPMEFLKRLNKLIS
ncbi:UNVERIFIED_CONTAM: hypothetical protein PYX00_011005 [Menopon gallinae]|uniref:Heat shock protein 83 n=1 Tax=Menopon gallinae TaxID=328185 RepID=A0AAW2H6J5_9NEOP